MATCANCLHHSLCDYNTNISGNGKVRLVYSEGADVKCSFFENTADVVPKSEVVKEVVEYIEKHLQYQRKKVDVPFTSRDMRNYQCGAIDVIEYFEELIAELKKKYTEVEHDRNSEG